MSTARAVRASIRKLPTGKPFTSERFLKHGSRSAVDRTLSRLARTFWEKATLVHVECHRGRLADHPERLSRH